MKAFLLCLLFIVLSSLGSGTAAMAQTPPGTDLLLVSMHDGAITLSEGYPLNLTDRDGYDNQPFFTTDGRAVLYTSGRGEQTDIYRVDLATRAHEQVTNTPESEYSATPLPEADGFSVVRVEADGAQRLWTFDAQGKNPALALEAVQPVGYHAWADAQTVALFVLGDPPTLQLTDTRTGMAKTLASNIGRSLHRVPGRATVSFVHKEADDIWTIKTLDPATGAVTPVMTTLPGREDYAWRADGSLLMADGPILYSWTPAHNAWQPLYDFTEHGVTAITRLAVSPNGDHLVLVVDRP